MTTMASVRRERWTGGGRWSARLLLVTAVVLVGCGERGADPGSDPVVVPAADVGARPDLSGLLPADRGDPPNELVVDDLVVGDGHAAVPGDALVVHFIGADWDTAATFDATWDRGTTYRFTLGDGRVIDGWDIGLEGVREGGRRLLIVPPDLGYGDRGSAGRIAPAATLVFVVDVIEIEPGVPGTSTGAGT